MLDDVSDIDVVVGHVNVHLQFFFSKATYMIPKSNPNTLEMWSALPLLPDKQAALGVCFHCVLQVLQSWCITAFTHNSEVADHEELFTEC